MTDKEFQVILEEGEGYRLEFKESLSNIDREMVAFANGSGGKLFLGITDDRVVKGVAIDNKLKAQIQDIANNCQPAVKILFEEYQNVLIVHVREGDDKPYKCSTGFYLRVGPNSQKLNRDEIIDFFKAEGKIRYDELVCTRFNYDEHFDAEKQGRERDGGSLRRPHRDHQPRRPRQRLASGRFRHQERAAQPQHRRAAASRRLHRKDGNGHQ
jgi:ATP-dependent DNA helicase RecG